MTLTTNFQENTFLRRARPDVLDKVLDHLEARGRYKPFTDEQDVGDDSLRIPGVRAEDIRASILYMMQEGYLQHDRIRLFGGAFFSNAYVVHENGWRSLGRDVTSQESGPTAPVPTL